MGQAEGGLPRAPPPLLSMSSDILSLRASGFPTSRFSPLPTGADPKSPSFTGFWGSERRESRRPPGVLAPSWPPVKGTSGGCEITYRKPERAFQPARQVLCLLCLKSSGGSPLAQSELPAMAHTV